MPWDSVTTSTRPPGPGSSARVSCGPRHKNVARICEHSLFARVSTRPSQSDGPVLGAATVARFITHMQRDQHHGSRRVLQSPGGSQSVAVERRHWCWRTGVDHSLSWEVGQAGSCELDENMDTRSLI